MKRLPCSLALFLLLTPWLPAQQSPDFDPPENEEDGQKRKSHTIFIRPAKETAAEELAHARSLAAEGRLGRATRHFDALVREWHDLPEAAVAQRELSVLLEKRRRYVRAFEEYQYLADFFGSRSSYGEVLDRQFRIANHVMNARVGRFLFFKGYRSPERALPLFEALLRNAPEWD
ncbi:MAG: tetratricopeptide repeat protein, partial [Lentisphaerae bacterium]|nr:tetratricopeptide repeat protein [Lentisphaerota bacterium]